MPFATNIRQCQSTGQSIDLFYLDTHHHESEQKDSTVVADETLIMVPGLNNCCYAFDDEYVEKLRSVVREKKNKNLRVIRIDNRDAGKSKTFEHLGQPWLYSISGFVPSRFCPAPHYTLTDMAEDIWALADRLKIQRASLWGHSMGGGIISEMLLLRPDRVVSFSPTMTSTFATDLSSPSLKTRLNFLKAPKSNSFDHMLDFKMDWYFENSLGPDAEVVDSRVRDYLKSHHTKVINHSSYNAGALRQINAIQHTRPRENLLREFAKNHEQAKNIPVFVLHGDQDKIFPVDHGERLADVFSAGVTSEKVGGIDLSKNKKNHHKVKFHLQKGMGHFLEPRFWDEIVESYVDHSF